MHLFIYIYIYIYIYIHACIYSFMYKSLLYDKLIISCEREIIIIMKFFLIIREDDCNTIFSLCALNGLQRERNLTKRKSREKSKLYRAQHYCYSFESFSHERYLIIFHWILSDNMSLGLFSVFLPILIML